MSIASSGNGTDASLLELLEFSSKALQRKTLQRSPFTSKVDTSTPIPPQRSFFLTDYVGGVYNGAAPLMPLRDRDMHVLADWFHQPDIHAIEADILHNLEYLYPAPCWEDDPFEFLHEFL
ncbi:hypothetical protein ACQ4M4_19660 [Leptolyngbya sp. AN02str]|uniref:hypothetical protein n=1 Tax=Leptolyngbya sp. AN02str TaxID=3423363 RepID=UPI003D3112CF